MFGTTRKQGFREYSCKDCGHKASYAAFAVRKGPRYNRERCQKCGSTFLASTLEDMDDDESFDGGPYQAMMEAKGWTFIPGQHNTPCEYASIQPA